MFCALQGPVHLSHIFRFLFFFFSFFLFFFFSFFLFCFLLKRTESIIFFQIIQKKDSFFFSFFPFFPLKLPSNSPEKNKIKMVFSVFCAADVYGSKWNVSVEFPGDFRGSGLSFEEVIEVIESAFEYECDRWRPRGSSLHKFYVEYVTLMEREQDGTMYSSERITEANYTQLSDGAQVHIHQKHVTETSSQIPPPRNTVAWRLVEMYGFPSVSDGPHIPSLFYSFDTRATGIITKETMLEGFPYPGSAGKAVAVLFDNADPERLGYVTFAAWLEFAAGNRKGVEVVIAELGRQKASLEEVTLEACKNVSKTKRKVKNVETNLVIASRDVQRTIRSLSKSPAPQRNSTLPRRRESHNHSTPTTPRGQQHPAQPSHRRSSSVQSSHRANSATHSAPSRHIINASFAAPTRSRTNSINGHPTPRSGGGGGGGEVRSTTPPPTKKRERRQSILKNKKAEGGGGGVKRAEKMQRTSCSPMPTPNPPPPAPVQQANNARRGSGGKQKTVRVAYP